MKLAVITDSSAALPSEVAGHPDLFVLDIPVTIDGTSYVEGVDLTSEEFYEKMAASSELPKTSQPSLAALDDILGQLPRKGYTHAIGLFLSSGISGFWQNIQYLTDEHPDLALAFPDTRITSAPLGMMVENTLNWAALGQGFDEISHKLDQQIASTKAFIMVDDLNHLVKGGRLSNGAAILGNLLSIKPILYFNDEGVIEVYEKVRTEKKAVKRLLDILKDCTADQRYQVAIIHANAPEKAVAFQEMIAAENVATDLPIVTFGSVIGTHLGEGAVAFGITPILD